MKRDYESLLAGFYTRIPPSWLQESCIDSFRLESDRRIMDISSRLWKYWPIGSQYAFANHGDDFVLGVAARFLVDRCNANTAGDSVRLSLFDWIVSQNDYLLEGLFRYESLLHSHLRNSYQGDLQETIRDLAKLPNGYALEFFDFDVLEFARLLQLYTNSHAPMYMWRVAAPSERSQVLASYARDGKIFAKDVTVILNNLLERSPIINMRQISE